MYANCFKWDNLDIIEHDDKLTNYEKKPTKLAHEYNAFKCSFNNDIFDDDYMSDMIYDAVSGYDTVRKYIFNKEQGTDKLIDNVIKNTEEGLKNTVLSKNIIGYRLISTELNVGDIFEDNYYVPIVCYKKALRLFKNIVKIIVPEGIHGLTIDYPDWSNCGLILLEKNLKFKCIAKNTLIVLK